MAILDDDSQPLTAEEGIGRIYEEVRRTAAAMLAEERRDHTLQPTALVHEAFLRLNSYRKGWDSPADFKAAIAVTLRRVLVDHARARNRQRRGGGIQREPMLPEVTVDGIEPADALALDEAIEQMRHLNPRHASVIEYRCFGGLSIDEIADVLDVSPKTVTRDWRMARAWLRQRLSDGPEAH